MKLPVKLKVCGITNEADALACAQAGVDYLGYVINYTASPRFIAPQVADGIIKKVKALFPKVQHVAVLVTPTEQFVSELEGLSFDLYQMYGNIVVSEKPVWQSEVGRVSTPQTNNVTMLHCDAGLGSGKTLPSQLLQNLKPSLPLVIAGGINSGNVREIIAACSPTVIDANSGVESAPGKKDIQKIYELQRLIFSN